MTRAAAVAPTATRTSAVDDEGIRRASSLGLEERRLSNLGEEGLHLQESLGEFVNGRTFINVTNVTGFAIGTYTVGTPDTMRCSP